MRVFHQNESCLLALSLPHNSREDGGKQGSSHFDKTLQYMITISDVECSDSCHWTRCLRGFTPKPLATMDWATSCRPWSGSAATSNTSEVIPKRSPCLEGVRAPPWSPPSLQHPKLRVCSRGCGPQMEQENSRKRASRKPTEKIG